MKVKASMVMGYRVRLLIIGMMLLLFAAWCAYDGFVVYPAQRDVYQTYLQVTEADEQGNETLPDFRRVWTEYAQANNLDTEKPTERSQWDIYTQYIMGALLLPPGLFFLAIFFTTSRRWYAMDDQGLHTSWGKHASWDQITDLDMTRWQTKGIAVVHFKQQGGEGMDRVTLDDWKYERDATTQIVEAIRERTGLGELPESADAGEDAPEVPPSTDEPSDSPPDETARA